MGKILDFLFGKDAEIFDDNGKVRHKLPKARWDDWENRFKSNPLYNWRLHTGTRAGGPPPATTPKTLKKS